MRIVSFANTLHDLNLLKENGCPEVILGHKDFSRFGELDDENFIKLATRARELSLKVIFEWDILMTENVFSLLLKKISSFLDATDVIRVQDPGALQWAFENTSLPLQFIAENGNHNLKSLETWVNYCQGRMERMILSIELTKDSIAEYVQKLNVPCEILGFGKILLFYTPRFLLSPLRGEKISENDSLSAVGESEESPHKGFPIVENRHGTFMFHIKEFSLVEFAQDLKACGLAFFRIDLREVGLNQLNRLKNLLDQFSEDQWQEFKKIYPHDLMKGFYLVNKTDVLFPKLKNSRLQNREGDYVGEVLEAEKSSHLAILVKNNRDLNRTDILRIVHPRGEEFEVKIYSLKNIDSIEVESVPSGHIALIQFVGGVWVKSQVFLQNK